MNRQRVLTLELPEGDWSRLEAAAHRAGVPAETLVRTAISRLVGEEAHDPRVALEELRRLRATLPEADAVAVVRQGRSALDARAPG
jgi:predicted DNA-binding protein